MTKAENDLRDLPLAILRETYRPLAFFAGEMLMAAAPFLPEISRTWAQRLIRMDVPDADKDQFRESPPSG